MLSGDSPAPTLDSTGVVSSRSVPASVRYTSSAPAEDTLATLELGLAGIGLIERVIDAQRSETSHFAISDIGVDGVFDQFLAGERAQHAARTGAPHFHRVVIGIERGVVAHRLERDARGLRLVVVVGVGVEVGHHVERGVSRAQIEEADLRIRAALLVTAAAGLKREREQTDQAQEQTLANSSW